MIGLARTAAILSAMTLGGLIPQAHVLAGGIRWLVIAMLFIVFLQIRFGRSSLHGSHVILFAANISVAFAAWGVSGLVGGRDIGLAAFFCGIAPTAAAAPVIMSFLRGRVEFVVAAFLITNVGTAALLPFLLPLVLGQATPEAFRQVSGSVGMIVFVPLAMAWLVRRIHPAAVIWPGKLRNVSFGMWLASMFLITSNASHFLRAHDTTPLDILMEIGLTSLLVCAANFAVGRWVGGHAYRREASQALGQKNTAFTIYLAMTYASPLVALGPTFYVIWHNLWNSWQLQRMGRRPAAGPDFPAGP